MCLLLSSEPTRSCKTWWGLGEYDYQRLPNQALGQRASAVASQCWTRACRASLDSSQCRQLLALQPSETSLAKHHTATTGLWYPGHRSRFHTGGCPYESSLGSFGQRQCPPRASQRHNTPATTATTTAPPQRQHHGRPTRRPRRQSQTATCGPRTSPTSASGSRLGSSGPPSRQT